MSKSKYFDYQEDYYSFGNKDNFGVISNSSVGMYGSKTYQNNDSNSKYMICANEMEMVSANEIGIAVNELGGIIPNIHRLISPDVDVAYDMQATHGNVNIQIVKILISGF